MLNHKKTEKVKYEEKLQGHFAVNCFCVRISSLGNFRGKVTFLITTTYPAEIFFPFKIENDIERMTISNSFLRGIVNLNGPQC